MPHSLIARDIMHRLADKLAIACCLVIKISARNLVDADDDESKVTTSTFPIRILQTVKAQLATDNIVLSSSAQSRVIEL